MFVPPLMTLLRGPQPVFSEFTLSGPSGSCAVYLATLDKTLVAWYSVGAGGYKTTWIAAYDHPTATWSERYAVGNFLLADDAHGQASICQDADGYIYVFYGSHVTPQPWSISTAPNDITAWTQQTALTGTQTYPHANVVGGVIYLMQRNDANTSRRTHVVRTATPSGGNATFSAMTTLVDLGADSRFYIGQCLVSGTDIHFVAKRVNAADTAGRGVYYFVYKTTTGAVTNHDGSFSVASGSLPVSLTDANANCRLFDHGTGEGDTPAFCFDSAGDPHVIFVDNGGSGGVYALKHIKRTAGVWSSPATVESSIFIEYPGAIGYKAVTKISPGAAAGSVEIWYVRDADGAKMRKIRDSGGTFSHAETIMTAPGTDLLVSHEAVREGHANFRNIFSEAIGSLATPGDAGAKTLRFYGWGDNGSVGGHVPQDLIDPHFANVSLLLGFEHRDGAIIAVNEAPSCIAQSARGGNAQIDTAQKKYGNSSLLLDGTGDFLSFPNTGKFGVAQGDFTVEWFFRRNASKLQVMLSRRPNVGSAEWVTYLLADNRPFLGVFNGAGAVVSITGVTATNSGQWYHFEVTRSGSTWRLFLDGVLEASGTESAAPLADTSTLNIGREQSATSARDFNGWIDEVRFTSGVCRHTATFTPPAAAHPRR